MFIKRVKSIINYSLPCAGKRVQLATHAVLAHRPPALGHGQGFDGGAVAHFVGVAAGAERFVFAFGAVVVDA